MKMGAFSAERSWRFYRLMALFGYGVGLPLTVAGTIFFLVNGYDVLHTAHAVKTDNLGNS